MRIIHTSDWHLGQKFISQSRENEQAMALDWLLNVIETENPDALIVAGDIFDVSNPPISAEELYYQFLTRLKETTCRHVVIVGGNHDSPFRLNAPRGLLRALHVHVVGAATDNPVDELIELTAADGSLQAVVAAVPFLRERDFSVLTIGETSDDRIRRIQQGIIQHYEALAKAVATYTAPIIATGHLYAKGASTHEEQQNIYLGNMDNIAAEQFPDCFNYIALGHIHRMQKVGKQDRIRYCGSLIPLSFSEKMDKKGVLVVDFDPKTNIPSVRTVDSPVFRRLLTIKGDLAEVEQKIAQLHDPADPLPAWIEVVVTGDPGIPMVDRHLRELAAGLHLELLKIKVERVSAALSEQMPQRNLSDLTPEEVFIKKCASAGLNEPQTILMKQEFAGLLAWMDEKTN